MKIKTKFTPRTLARLRTFGLVLAMLALNTPSLFAQAFSSTELKTGISNTLAVIMMFGFVLGIAAAPAVIFAFFKIFGLDGNSSVGVGNF